MPTYLTQLGTSLVILHFALAVAPPRAHACVVDAGVWVASMDVGGVSERVPADGAVVVRLRCTSGQDCPDAARQAVGNVLAPDGSVLPGSWSEHAGPTLVFKPTASFAVGAGYRVELNRPAPTARAFEVVEAIGYPSLAGLAPEVTLGDLVRSGVPESSRCCEPTDDCGSNCYLARQVELAGIRARVDGAALSTLALGQLEITASGADSIHTSCIGCTELALLDGVARNTYCVDLSARWLAHDEVIHLGQACTATGYSVLRMLDTPASDVPAACRASNTTGSDAGVSPNALDGGGIGSAQHRAAPGASGSAPHGGCSAVGTASDSVSWWLPLLLLFALRRRARAGSNFSCSR